MSIQDWKDQWPAELADSSKVWVYQSNRPFSEKEEKEINEQLYQFYVQWNSHGTPVKGWAGVLFNRFIVFIADETASMVSGCSTDSSVRVVKSIEKQYEINLFDRLAITFLVKGKAEMLPFSQIQYAIDKDYIDAETPVFNNIVQTLEQLKTQWLVPLKQSWMSDRVNLKM